LALGLALVSTSLVNLAYVREQAAAVALPPLSLRHPLRSLRALLTDRDWLLGFGMESTGFLLYVAALALGSLALVQSVTAGGIGLLAFATARFGHRPLSRREQRGVALALAGLVALGVSLAGGSGPGRPGSLLPVVTWLAATAGAALFFAVPGRRLGGDGVGQGIAGGLLFSFGDISTKLATQGGGRIAFVGAMVLGYGLGTAMLQLGYQRAGALTVAGIATLLTTALPIAAGTVVFNEPIPGGALGGVRVLAFVAVTAGALLLARPRVPIGPAARPRRARTSRPESQPAHAPGAASSREAREAGRAGG
jgi:hypothetical protein